MEELKAFLQEQLRNAYDLKEGQSSSSPGLMREAERFFILQQIDTFGNISRPYAEREVGLRGYGQKDFRSNTRTRATTCSWR